MVQCLFQFACYWGNYTANGAEYLTWRTCTRKTEILIGPDISYCVLSRKLRIALVKIADRIRSTFPIVHIITPKGHTCAYTRTLKILPHCVQVWGLLMTAERIRSTFPIFYIVTRPKGHIRIYYRILGLSYCIKNWWFHSVDPRDQCGCSGCQGIDENSNIRHGSWLACKHNDQTRTT